MFDNTQRFVRSGLKVYLRVKNFPETGDNLEVGVPFTVTGSLAAGYTDYLIKPPPNVQDVSMHNIGIMAGRLNFGSRIFTISHTFVKEQLDLINEDIEEEITDPLAVFRDRNGLGNCLGILYDQRLFSIESITHRDVSGQTISWKLICNSLETTTSAPVNEG